MKRTGIHHDRLRDERLVALLRAALQGRAAEADRFVGCDAAAYDALYRSVAAHGVLALAWDGARTLPAPLQPPAPLRLQWALNVQRIERLWHHQAAVLGRLAAFYRDRGIPTMVLKGYGTSLCYPIPAHRPCGDIDIWLYGHQSEADRLLASERGVRIERRREHHTTFEIGGVPVENHSDFFDTRKHASNARLEPLLKRLAAQPAPTVPVGNAVVHLPPVQFDALFLLRHTAVHFAAIGIGLRHVVDWRVFVARRGDRIDWAALRAAAREAGMEPFLDCLNAICIDRLGLEPDAVPPFVRNEALTVRVLDEILAPRFPGAVPAGALRSLVFRMRRWWAGRWKHRIVYSERLVPAFLRSLRAHLRSPRPTAG